MDVVFAGEHRADEDAIKLPIVGEGREAHPDDEVVVSEVLDDPHAGFVLLGVLELLQLLFPYDLLARPRYFRTVDCCH